MSFSQSTLDLLKDQSSKISQSVESIKTKMYKVLSNQNKKLK